MRAFPITGAHTSVAIRVRYSCPRNRSGVLYDALRKWDFLSIPMPSLPMQDFLWSTNTKYKLGIPYPWGMMLLSMVLPSQLSSMLLNISHGKQREKLSSLLKPTRSNILTWGTPLLIEQNSNYILKLGLLREKMSFLERYGISITWFPILQGRWNIPLITMTHETLT